MRRREFIAGIGSAAAWPVVARAQQSDRIRRIGVLMGGDENDSAWRTRLSAFTQALADLGWTDGRNVRMDVRWAGGGNNRIRALAPAPVSTYMPSFETAARSLKVELITALVSSDEEIETIIIELGRELGSGLIVMPDVFMVLHRAPIILAAARNNVPAVYSQSAFARDGGLLSYGTDSILDPWRRAATYVDRILGGAKPAELPVQQPTKFELVINLKTAKALGLAIPETLLATADEVIQ